MAIARFSFDETALLVVDLQEKLLPIVHDHEQVLARARVLVEGCRSLGVPILATEQYPQRLGATVEPIREVLPEGLACQSKLKFSACIQPIREQLQRLGRRSVIVCGVETHVCVLQTALDLAEWGFLVAVSADAVGSRRPLDHQMGMQRMTQAGIVPATTEMLLLEMVHEAGTDRFKAMLPIVK